MGTVQYIALTFVYLAIGSAVGAALQVRDRLDCKPNQLHSHYTECEAWQEGFPCQLPS